MMLVKGFTEILSPQNLLGNYFLGQGGGALGSSLNRSVSIDQLSTTLKPLTGQWGILVFKENIMVTKHIL